MDIQIPTEREIRLAEKFCLIIMTSLWILVVSAFIILSIFLWKIPA